MMETRNGSPNRSISGQLDDFHLVELVQAMDVGNSSGAIELNNQDERRGIIYFEHGALSWCHEYSDQALSLGMVVQQLGMVKKQTIDAIVARNANDPLNDLMGHQLLEAGDLTQAQLFEALRTQMLWTVREMALWANGTYEFRSGEAPPHRSSVSGVSSARFVESPPIEASNVALEIVRYEYAWNELTHWLPKRINTELRMVPHPPDQHQLIFPAPVWRLITRVNAYHTPRKIAVALYQPELETARMLAPLVYDGLLTAKSDGEQVNVPITLHTAPLGPKVNLFMLISQMLQDYLNRKTLVDQLTAMAHFINLTMQELELELMQMRRHATPDSLAGLLHREGCDHIGTFPLRIVSNRIDIEHLKGFLHTQLEAARRGGTHTLAETANRIFGTLQKALVATFIMINRRVDSHEHRQQNEQTWSAMFAEFHLNLILK